MILLGKCFLKKKKKLEAGHPFQEVHNTERRMIHRKREADKQPV